MTLTIPISPEVENRLRQLAEEAGKDLPTYLAEVIKRAAAQAGNGGGSVADFDRALDELFAADSQKTAASSPASSRADIYFDHD